MPLGTVTFNPQAGYNGSYRVDFCKKSDTETVINSVTINPPLSTPIVASATLPTLEEYVAFIYSLACEADTGGKLVSSPVPLTPQSICAAPTVISASVSDDADVEGNWTIINGNNNFNITDIRINGNSVTVPSGFFPILPGQSKTMNGPVNQTIASLSVLTNENGSNAGSIILDMVEHSCTTFDGSGIYTFTNVEVDDHSEITMGHQICA